MRPRRKRVVKPRVTRKTSASTASAASTPETREKPAKQQRKKISEVEKVSVNPSFNSSLIMQIIIMISFKIYFISFF